MHRVADCIFCKIAHGELAAKKVLETESCVAFHDVNPMAPIHVLVIPKMHIASVNDLDEKMERIPSQMLFLAKQVATELDMEHSGFRLVINTGKDAGQTVGHLHVHVLGGRELSWPPG